jgi:hypothetical protein
MAFVWDSGCSKKIYEIIQAVWRGLGLLRAPDFRVS